MFEKVAAIACLACMSHGQHLLSTLHSRSREVADGQKQLRAVDMNPSLPTLNGVAMTDPKALSAFVMVLVGLRPAAAFQQQPATAHTWRHRVPASRMEVASQTHRKSFWTVGKRPVADRNMRADGGSFLEADFMQKYQRRASQCQFAVDEERVEDLILKRQTARGAKDFRAADEITVTLLQEHGVKLDDRKRTWECIASPGADLSKPLKRQEIPSMADDQQHVRAESVEVDDQQAAGEESVEGDDKQPAAAEWVPAASEWIPGEEKDKSLTEDQRWEKWGHDLLRAEDDAVELDAAALTAIHGQYGLLQQRRMAAYARDYEEAARILKELNETYGVSVHDRRKLWRADGGSFLDETFLDGYQQVGSPAEEEALDKEQVDELIHQRQVARAKRAYKLADRLKIVLLTHGVVVNDKAKEWQYVSPGVYVEKRLRKHLPEHMQVFFPE
mmetsp:Transcript_21582/g.39936  ORF Transcript_21582/g.39936 Transcript_21582/m.39936 type:complete len:445 (-) Transcript_21582:24-1358(-)